MISIFIMYSADRRKALDYTISCLEDMEQYKFCQKTLVVDGKTDYIPYGYEIVQVPRVNNEFSWANMWNAGVYSARHSIIVYLDADRLLHPDFLAKAEEIADGQFQFTSKHFHMLGEISLEGCKRFLRTSQDSGIFMDDEFLGLLKYEPRFKNPLTGPGKNVMSGSTIFTRETFMQLGGIDQWYKGHGAYADTDFHFQAAKSMCKFEDLDIPEIHYHHKKLGSDNIEIDDITLGKMGLYNFIYYCKKWELPLIYAESLATRCGILKPSQYVEEKLEEIRCNL